MFIVCKKVTNIKKESDKFTVTYENSEGIIHSVDTQNIFFSNPLLEFIDIFDDDTPQKVIDSAKSLNYRNHISVHVTIDKKLFDDNWIYIHSPNIKMARIADFTNFSKDMSEEGTFPLTLEYFCFEEEEIWNEDNENIITYALNELKEIFDEEFKVIHSQVTRNSKAYPVIETGYQIHIDIIKEWLSSLSNITAIGRSGMFKYNNQDHAMATGIYAARTLLGVGNYDPWEVNVDGEYHEEIGNN